MDEPRVGRELDTLIAELMGWTNIWELFDRPIGLPPEWAASRANRTFIPHFSIGLLDAWKVVEWLNGLGWLVTVKQIPEGEPFWMTNDPVAEPNARLMRRAICELYWVYRANKDRPKAAHPHPCSYGDTAPEAICRAALMVADNEGKEG